jgi:hypothetical protein
MAVVTAVLLVPGQREMEVVPAVTAEVLVPG